MVKVLLWKGEHIAVALVSCFTSSVVNASVCIVLLLSKQLTENTLKVEV